jgi:hypothetical protein
MDAGGVKGIYPADLTLGGAACILVDAGAAAMGDQEFIALSYPYPSH